MHGSIHTAGVTFHHLRHRLCWVIPRNTAPLNFIWSHSWWASLRDIWGLFWYFFLTRQGHIQQIVGISWTNKIYYKPHTNRPCKPQAGKPWETRHPKPWKTRWTGLENQTAIRFKGKEGKTFWSPAQVITFHLQLTQAQGQLARFPYRPLPEVQ